MPDGLTFGVDYYPEQWDESMWERDADRMRDFGFTVARLMEFAWSVVEPEEGRLDFSLFDRAMGVLAKRGIRTILGTPTAAVPAWLADEAGVFGESPAARRGGFGRRRTACFNSPAYREAARRIVAAAADRFGRDERVLGWQVDNEIGHEGSDVCVCPNCRRAWREWLARRYVIVDALNKEWGSVFWSGTISRFDQAPVPSAPAPTQLSPGLLLDYQRFSSDSAVAFADEQVALLRERIRPECFVTTNLFLPPVSNAIDMERLVKNMDFAGYDNYPAWGPDREPHHYAAIAMALSYVRGLSPEPFSVLEQFAGAQGHELLGYLPPERQAALWTNQAIARGANRILYFRWRTAPFGQEQLCSGILDADDRETERARVLRGNAKAARAAFSAFASAPFESSACLVYSKDDARALRDQSLSAGLALEPNDWIKAGYEREMAKWFAPYVVFNVNADVKSAASVDLDRYSAVSLPLYQMADPEFVARVDEWVRRGGHLILGYRAGTRDMRNWNVREPLPGLFEEMAGIRIPRFEALGDGEVGIRVGAFPAKGGVWADLVEPRTAAAVATWSDGRAFYSGLPCATVNVHGRGKVWYIGTSPDPRATFLLYRRILREAGLEPRFHGSGIEVVERRTIDGGRVKVVLNHTSRRRRVLGRRVEPYGWAVVE